MRTIIVIMLLLTVSAFAGTHYVDDDACYYIDSWPYGSIPQPTAEWRFADGIDYDTTGSAEYRNYGDGSLVTQMTDVNRPGLAEGILAEGQTALAYDGVNDKLWIDDVTVLDENKTSFTVAAWVRPNQMSEVLWIVTKFNYRMRADSELKCAVTDRTDWIYDIGGDISLDVWHFCALVIDWGAKTVRLYLNGDWVTTPKDISAIDSLGSSYNYAVGAKTRYADGNWFGDIALVQHWSGTALTKDQLDSLYAAMHPTGTASLPYPSFQAAVYQASSGDTILGAAGRYRETIEITDEVVLTATSTAYDARPELYGTDLIAPSGTSGMIVRDTVEISYLDIRGYTTAYGIYADSATNGSLFHNILTDSCMNGIGVYGTAWDDSIFNCTFDGAGRASTRGVYAYSGCEVGQDTIRLYNNIFYDLHVGWTGNDSCTIDNSHNDFWDCKYNPGGSIGIRFDVDPLFRSSTDYRFRNPVLWGSGTDWRNYSLPDIGAYPYCSASYLSGRNPWGRNGRWGRGRGFGR